MPRGARRQDLLELHHNTAVRLRTPLPEALAAAARHGAAAALADLEPTHLVRAAALLLWPAHGQARGPRRPVQPTLAPLRPRAGCSRPGRRGRPGAAARRARPGRAAEPAPALPRRARRRVCAAATAERAGKPGRGPPWG